MIAALLTQAGARLACFFNGHRRGKRIKIIWRRGESYDYHTTHEQGCIVDATSVPGEEVKRCFKTAGEAVRYIAAMLKKHDAMVRETKAKRDQEARNKARLAKALSKRQPEKF
jgi:hypothetical protein